MPASEAQSQVSSVASSTNQDFTAKLRPTDADPAELGFSTACMSVCYTVCKDKATTGHGFVIARLFLDWLQLWLLVVRPPQFAIASDQLWWRVLSFVNMRQFMTVRGPMFFFACFYLLVASLFVFLGFCGWLAYSSTHHRESLPKFVLVLRTYCRVFLYLLDVMSLIILIIPLDCQMFGVPDNLIASNKEFGYTCWTMSYAIHSVLAMVSSIIFMILAAIFCVGQNMELDLKTRNVGAVFYIGTELKLFVARILLVLVTQLVYIDKWLSVAQLTLTLYMTYTVLYWQPQLVGWVNHVRTGAYMSVCWCSFLYVFLAFNLGWNAADVSATANARDNITLVMGSLLVPVFMFGTWVSWKRLRSFDKQLNRYRYPEPDSVNAYKLEDSRVVEILARCCRVWIHHNELEPNAVLLAEFILKVGLVQMPKDPFMVVLFASFLIDVQNSFQSGYTQLQHARKMDCSILMRYAIFSCEQKHAQHGAQDGVGSEADLANLIEFQKQYSLVLTAHREALLQIKMFWHSLTHSNVQFSALATAVQAMDAAVLHAEQVYRPVLERHAGHVQIVRLYAKFLEHVRLDPWGAARWFAEGDRLEALEEDEKSHDALGGMQVHDPAIRAAMLNAGQTTADTETMQGRAVIVMDAQSIIQITNQAAQDLLGYTKTELKGKPLSLILPAAIADVHGGYVKNYLRTGQEVALNRTQSQLVVHKEKRLVPVKLTALRVSGTGEDTMFVGIMEEILTRPNQATCWLGLDGTVLGVDSTFEDWLGYMSKEVLGTKFGALALSGADVLEEGLRLARSAQSEAHRKTVMREDNTNGSGTQDVSHGTIAFRIERIAADYLARASLKLDLDGSVEDDDEQPQGMLPAFAMRALHGKAKVEQATKVYDIKGVQLAHKFGLIAGMDLRVTSCGMGSMRFQTVVLEKCHLTAGIATLRARAVESALPSMIIHQSRPASVIVPHAPDASQAFLETELVDFLSPFTRDVPRTHAVSEGGSGLVPEQSGLKTALSRNPAPFISFRQEGARPSETASQHVLQQEQEVQCVPLGCPLAQDLMLVVNSKGQVLHCTSAFAEKLGRTRQAAMANGMNSALELLLVEPFSQLHRGLLTNVIVAAEPPYSCRSGLSVLMLASSVQNRAHPVPFKLSVHRSQQQSGVVHVVQAEERNLSQALDERRLLLRVNHEGMITQVMSHCAKVFGLEDLQSLQGRSLAQLVTLFRPPDIPTEAVLTSDESETAVQVLLKMATQAFDDPGRSWRCGVITWHQYDGVMEAIMETTNLLTSQVTPAIMRLVTNAPDKEGLDGWIQVELWRADMVSSVISIDNEGFVLPAEYSELEELYPPGLITGHGSQSLLDKHISTIVPDLASVALRDMFTPGILGQTMLAPRQAEAKTGLLKNQASTVDARVGPQQLLIQEHPGDGQEQSVCLQAVRKGSGTIAYQIILRPVAPTAGRQDFSQWVIRHGEISRENAEATLRHRLSRKMSQKSAKVVKANFGDVLSPSAHQQGRKGSYPDSPAKLMRKVSAGDDWAQLPERNSLITGRSPRRTRRGSVLAASVLVPSAFTMPSSSVDLDTRGEEEEADAEEDCNSDGEEAVTKSVRVVEDWLEKNSTLDPPDNAEPDADMSLADGGGSMRSSMGNSVRRLSVRPGGPQERRPQRPADASDAEDHEMPADAEAMQGHDDGENAVADGDFKRGQRLKKLMKILSSSTCLAPCEDYYRKALLIALIVCVVQVGAFVTFVFLLNGQHQLVTELSRIGQAGVRATDIAVWTRTINMIYEKMEVPTLRLVSSPNDLPYLKQLYKEAIEDFTNLHQGVFLGFTKPRRLPDKYGLRSIWEQDTYTVNISAEIQYNQSLGNFTLMRIWEGSWKMGLWEAGNTLSEKAASFLQNADAYNATLGGNLSAFANSPDLNWIINNSPETIFPGYLSTQDAYLQLVLDNLNNINTVQLILLAVQGIVLCAALSSWTWWLLKRLASRRYSLFFVFMIIPVGNIRSMANRQFNLDEDDADDGPEFEEPASKPTLVPPEPIGAPPPTSTDVAKQAVTPGGPGPSRLRFKDMEAKDMTAVTAEEAGDDKSRAEQKKGFFVNLVRYIQHLNFVKDTFPPSVVANATKRKLHHCRRTTVKFMLPVLLWGALVVVTNGVGYVLLGNVAGPCALFNIVNYVMLLYNRNNFWLQELTYEPDYHHMDFHRAVSAVFVHELRKEYTVMVYGSQAYPNETSFHYTSITTGVAHAGAAGTSILFGTDSCLCLNATECHPPDSHLYPDTSKGLDRMMLKYLEIGDYIEQFQYLDPYLNGPEYDFYWNTVPDMKGGFSRLADAYEQFVATNTQYVLILHVVALTLTLTCVGLYVLTCLRPFIRSTRSEARRVAELLSQLPTELDVNAILDKTLLLDMGVTRWSGQPTTVGTLNSASLTNIRNNKM